MGLRPDQMTKAADVKVGQYYGAEGDERILLVEIDGGNVDLTTSDGYTIHASANTLVPVRNNWDEVLTGEAS